MCQPHFKADMRGSKASTKARTGTKAPALVVYVSRETQRNMR